MRIADHDLLVVDQVTGFMSNDFAIRDSQGMQVGHIATEGGMLSRMFAGARQLAIVEPDGSLALRVYDTPTFGRDRFQLLDAHDQQVGEIVKEFTFFSKRLSINLATGDVLELSGSFFDYEFTVTGPVGQAAQVSRQWPGLAGGLFGYNRYVLGFTPGTPDFIKYPILGTVVALDLIREKESERGNSGGSVFF